MSKNDVISIFETDLSDPGADKSGEYLQEHILNDAKKMLLKDRIGLIEAVRDWLEIKSEPRTMLAVSLVKDLGLHELTQDLIVLKKEIIDKKIFPQYYLIWIEKALSVLEEAS